MFVRIFQGLPKDTGLVRQVWSDVVSAAGGTGAVAGPTTAGEWAGLLWSETDAPIDEPEARLFPALAGAARCFGSSDLQLIMAGWPPAEARFVQLMQAVVSDREAWAEVDAVGVPRFAATRPDFLGTVRVWQPGNRLTVIDSFTSEAEARAGEAIPPPAEDEPVYQAWFGYLTEITWHDLIDPWRD